jgi:hypothetical protein
MTRNFFGKTLQEKALYLYKTIVHISRTILTNTKVRSKSDTSRDNESFVCPECKARCRSGDLLNEHMYEEHGKQ